MSLRDRQRVIYTSPIKALSNQKFRELQAEFKDVGLMTGDISINPTASCLVMTTEILRSMLYKGSEVLREVAWVVFDEVHYMRDKERGVVWEETLILLPDTVKFVFLSATIPNAKQFAEWICKIHSQPCHVVYTDYRPTPLQHYLFAAGGDGVHLAVDEKGVFREDNFQKAISVLIDFDPNEAALGKASVAKRRAPRKDPKALSNDLLNIVKLIQAKQNLPVIVFSFSKKDCESHAIKLAKMDFNTEEEKTLVDTVFCNAIESLPLEDRTLPQITSILPLLKRGVGIHHSGLLPILKEIIEILFQEGLIKILFATETFSIGLNMPAKTVVFTSVRKFDGKTFRWISGGEYIQMSGRAGRRGLDDRGIVILMLDEKMEPAVAKGMLKGQADPLNSAFYLSYNMILNLMRVEGIAPESMLAKSFFQFQNNSTLPTLEGEAERLSLLLASSAVNSFTPEIEQQLQEYSNVAEAMADCEGSIRKIVHHPSIILPFIQPGRLIWVKEESLEAGAEVKDFGWGCIVGLARKGGYSKEDPLIEVLLLVKASSYIPLPKDANSEGEMRIVPIRTAAIFQASSVRIHLPRSGDLQSEEGRKQVLLSLCEVKKRLGNEIPLLCPHKDLGIKDEAFSKLTIKHQLLSKRLEALTNDQLISNLPAYREKLALQRSLKAVRRSIQELTAITHMEELKCRKRILRRLNYLTEDGVIELKGRVACEIGTGDELMLTELMFNGAFNDLSVEHTVAFLSAFVCEEKSNNSANGEGSNANSTLREELSLPLKMLQETGVRISKISTESALPGFDGESYMAKFRFELMDVVWAWSRGAKFWQVCKMTPVFEGNIIRCMKRLEELLRQMCQAAKSIGNSELECKFSEGITKIKRDIVFANSLYL